MANEKNLKPFTSDQSREEAAKNGKKGGVASGVAKRKKASLKKAIASVLSLKVDDSTAAQLSKLGIEDDEQIVQTSIIVAQALKAMRGDTKAADFLVRNSGDNPQIEIEKERLKLEKERLALAKSREQSESANGDENVADVHIYLPENGRNNDE